MILSTVQYLWVIWIIIINDVFNCIVHISLLPHQRLPVFFILAILIFWIRECIIVFTVLILYILLLINIKTILNKMFKLTMKKPLPFWPQIEMSIVHRKASHSPHWGFLFPAAYCSVACVRLRMKLKLASSLCNEQGRHNNNTWFVKMHFLAK